MEKLFLTLKSKDGNVVEYESKLYNLIVREETIKIPMEKPYRNNRLKIKKFTVLKGRKKCSEP